jgi:hypothetical protein
MAETTAFNKSLSGWTAFSIAIPTTDKKQASTTSNPNAAKQL